MLKNNEIKYFTYTPREEKATTILLKNLDGDFDPEQVLEDLKNKNIENTEFITVKKFATQRSRKEGKILPIYANKIDIIAEALDINCKHKPDVVLLSETKLNPRHKISFKNYNFVRRDRINSKQAGETGILIRNDIKFKNIQLNCIKRSTCFETTVLEIKFQNNQKLYLIAAYATSSCKKEFMLELKAVFDALELNKASNYYLLAGDLNAKHFAWGNTINNARGVSLNKWFLENQITFRIDLYRTAVSSYPKSGAFIDLCLIDNRIKLQNTIGPNLLRSFRYDSDHRASILTISIPSTDYFLFEETVTEIKFNFNRTDWTTFKEYLNNHNNPIIPNNRNLKTNEIDIHIDTLNKNILHAIENTVPRIDHNTNSTDKYITPRIKNLRKQKNYIITQMNRLTNLRNYTSAHDLTIDTYKKALKAIRYEIKKAFQESVSNYWKRKVSNISLHKPKELFPSVNGIFRPKNSSDIDILKIPTTNRNLLEKANLNPQSLLIESNKFLITDTVHKLDIIGAHFESVHTQNSHMGKPQLSNIILHKIETLQQEMQLDKDNDVTVYNKIPRKNVVRYLGLHLDFKLNYNEHILSQIDKAQKSFLSHKRLFYSKDLDKCVKILCYKLLIRPILTYGCPIWYNISAGTMEKLRIFERKCLRACLGKYRSPESNYKKMISNYKLYEEAKLIRIDLFILKLIRNHWSCVNKLIFTFQFNSQNSNIENNINSHGVSSPNDVPPVKTETIVENVKAKDLIKIIKQKNILKEENAELLAHVTKVLTGKNTVKRLNPKPNLIFRKNQTVEETTKMKPTKAKPTQSSKQEESPKPSYEELLKIITNLNETVANLSKQLEEERKRKKNEVNDADKNLSEVEMESAEIPKDKPAPTSQEWSTITRPKRKNIPNAVPAKTKEDPPTTSTSAQAAPHKKPKFGNEVNVPKQSNSINKPPPIVVYESFKLACKSLKTNKIEFFTYTPKQEKVTTILLKNLEGEFDPDTVLEHLKSKNIDNIEFKSVKKFTTQRSIKEGRNLPIYLVQISQDSRADNVTQIKTLLHSLVSWEKLIKKDRIQCKRCQRIGHVALNCNLKYRCVKCNEPHNPGECPRTSNSDAQPYCANCKQFGHPASYRGCPKLVEIKQKIEDKKQQLKLANEKKEKLVNKLVKPNVSFSAIVSNTNTHTNPYQQPSQQPYQSRIQPNTNTTPHTSLLEEIKNIITVTINSQISQLAESIAANRNRINIIAEALEISI
ncbi:Nucleic-acid-binding protein from transposon X-element [Anthophora plagiata]